MISIQLSMLLGMAYGLFEAGLGVLKRSRDDAVDADRSSLRVLWITIVLSLGAGILASQKVPEAAIGSPVSPWLGCVLFCAGITLRWHAISYLGRYFTVNVAIHSRHEVIDTGPYRLIRHPAYAGELLALLGLVLCIGNWLSLVLVMLPIALAFGRRIVVEEAALASALGTPYTRYMQRTKRLAPYIY